MTIADHPLHRSGRAALPHPAPALGRDGEAHARIGMTDTWRREPAVDVRAHATPRQMVALTPATQDAPPELDHRRPKRIQRRAVQRDTVVPVMPEDDRAQIRALLRNGLMQTSPELGLDRSQLGLPPRTHRLAQHREPSLPRLRAAMREAQKIEGLRFPVATDSPILVCEATEFEESRFVGMQRQSEPREALAQVGEEAVSFHPVLESDDEVIGKAHDNDVALRVPRSPSLDPEVEDIVQVDVRQQRTPHAPYAKGNFQFERVIAGWREQSVLDLRRK